ncbi:alpha-L-arabinofuranosidase C-terminal domain-containing protein [Paenibacillus prosopidis]|uniref:non-reducing end alpha-L-arabinofuranosidase n=1 Tax=Paenibacillus prosopidis TaxID=630520 RepID=A0A368VYB8_9BACL|nr:alpha-L-arabinofuranosidase C-terminal domain-containing protein [Paenibacillus prosopidis]RCW46407.1 alpha-L-arabinofuranosidase [Paenibacillus prosopidis]
MSRLEINPKRELGRRDKKIYGHFLEHFHRQIYGGIFDPESPLSGSSGYRQDVMEALKRIEVPIVRWPGGCFVSAYHWKDAIGKQRTPYFDKAWRVEESNKFGTDEFIEYCRLIGAEPYICTNAGTGSPEEMSDWVEYCNLPSEGKWAKLRIENGHPEPYKVKYWSIGNENYGDWEMGAKNLREWGRFVKESAKMMKRVDPNIELLAASISDLDWNLNLLREAGNYLDWISIHDYWDHLGQVNDLSNYESCMAYTMEIEKPILKTKNILGSLGYLGRIRIAYDEWNLRGWHHPHINSGTEDYITPRDKNDINSSYTMADAVFTACFLNQCHKHSDVVGMANFAPTVNTRGAIFTHQDGLVLRSSYFVFELYIRHLGDIVVDSWLSENSAFDVETAGKTTSVPHVDAVATKRTGSEDLRIALVNRHPDRAESVSLHLGSAVQYSNAVLYSVVGDSKDAYNDIGKEQVRVIEQPLHWNTQSDVRVEIQPHSVNVLVIK